MVKWMKFTLFLQLSSSQLPEGAEFLQRQLDESLDKLKIAERDTVEKQKVSDQWSFFLEGSIQWRQCFSLDNQ